MLVNIISKNLTRAHLFQLSVSRGKKHTCCFSISCMKHYGNCIEYFWC